MHYTPNCAAQQVELNHPKFGQPLQATNEAASRCSLGSFSLLSGYGNMAAVAAASQHPALGSVSRGPPSPLSLSFDTHVPVQNRLPRLSLSLARFHGAHTHARTRAHALSPFLPRSRISLAASLSLSLSLSSSSYLATLRRLPISDLSPFIAPSFSDSSLSSPSDLLLPLVASTCGVLSTVLPLLSRLEENPSNRYATRYQGVVASRQRERAFGPIYLRPPSSLTAYPSPSSFLSSPPIISASCEIRAGREGEGARAAKQGRERRMGGGGEEEGTG